MLFGIVPSQLLTCVPQDVGEYLFSGEGECVVLPCSNAVAGERYTDAGSRRYGTPVGVPSYISPWHSFLVAVRFSQNFGFDRVCYSVQV